MCGCSGEHGQEKSVRAGTYCALDFLPLHKIKYSNRESYFAEIL